MDAIVYQSDGFSICQQVTGVSPDPVVTWITEAAAEPSSPPRVAMPTSRRYS